MTIDEVDLEAELATQIAAVAAAGGAVRIEGGNSKAFYGEPVEGLAIEVGGHSGVIDYDPAELVITLRAGCPLAEVEALLAGERQMFGFEPPAFGPGASIGGTLATALAGPRRAYAGGVRDFVLGIKMIDGRGETLSFGGRVIKNVAGFDVSRLLVGSLGTLGVILEASIRVMPIPETELTLAFAHADAEQHIGWINALGGEPWPISAACWHDGTSRLRLSGSERGVAQAAAKLGGEAVEYDWRALLEQDDDFFAGDAPLTRVALPPTTDDLAADAAQLIEWGGAQRWLRGEVDLVGLREQAAKLGGNVCAFRGHPPGAGVFQPQPDALLRLQRNLKSSFDPAGIFNPGRLYPGL